MRTTITIILVLVFTEASSQFAEKQLIYPTDQGFYAAQLMDLNADGEHDLVTVNGIGEIFIRLCTGEYEFGEPNIVEQSAITNLKHMAEGFSIQSIDIDGDEDSDLVFYYSSYIANDPVPNYMQIFINNGSGSLLVGYGEDLAWNFDFCDFDTDGMLDMIYGVEQQVVWRRYNGELFEPEALLGTYTDNWGYYQHADIDNDGDEDLFYGSNQTNNYVWIENTDAALGTATEMFEYGGEGFFDMDGDGDLDFVDQDYDGSNQFVVIRENIGLGNFGDPFWICTYDGVGAFHYFVRDINGDQLLDVVYGGYQSYKYWPNLGGMLFGELVTLNFSTPGHANEMIDLNEDGYVDFFVSGPHVHIKENLNGTSTITHSLFEGPRSNSYFSATQIGGSSALDLMSSSGDSYEASAEFVLHEINDFGPIQTFYEEDDNYISERVDVDGDGDLDLLTISSWYENNQDGTFTTHLFDVWIGSAYYGTTLDFDGDGLLDFFSSYATAYDADTEQWLEGALVYMNIGQSSNPEVIELLPYNGINEISLGNDYWPVGNFDGDEEQEIALHNLGTGEVLLFDWNNGNPTQTVLWNSLLYTVDMAELDFDGDGLEDIYIQDELGIHLLKNEGNNSFQEVAYSGLDVLLITETGGGYTNETTDMNNDGFDDLIAHAYGWSEDGFSSCFLYIALSAGNGNFNIVPIDVCTGDDNQIIDWNGDGDLDILFENSYGGNLFYIENELDQFSSFEVSGTVFLDENADGIKQVNENGLPYLPVAINPGGYTVFTNSAGVYAYYPFTTGEFEIDISVPNSDWTSTSPSSITAIVTDLNNTSIDNNFAIAINNEIDQIETSHTYTSSTCNESGIHWISVHNNGATTPSGIVQLNLDSLLEFQFANPAPDSVNSQGIYWHFDSLFYFSQVIFSCVVAYPGVEFIGDTISSDLTLHLLDTLNNEYNVIQSTTDEVLLCAYDPNDKTEHTGLGSDGIIQPNNDLEYTIRFQNTGNAMATNVRIEDELSNLVDWNTIQPMAWSHDFEMNLDPSGNLTFNFSNIMLPDSGSNELESHGFIRFRISQIPDNAPGSTINNTALIFFDMNPAIVTNTTLNTIAIPENLIDQAEVQFLIYPNPSYDFFTIIINHTNNKSEGENILVTDMLGRELMKIENAVSGMKVDVRGWASGMYQLRVDGAETARFVKL